MHFTVVTDHYSLIWLDRLKDPTGRLGRWALQLQQYKYTIIHRKGKDNVVPDFLSRSVSTTQSEANPIINTIITADHQEDPWIARLRNKINKNPEKFPKFRVEQDKIYKYTKCQLPELATTRDYWKEIVPKNFRNALIKENHDSVTAGHFGIHKTYWRLQNKYFWPKMKSDVKQYVNKCQICAQNKPEQKLPAGLMGERQEIKQPWQLISLDFIGPLPRTKSGNTHILVIVDYFSKYPVIIPVRKANGITLTKHVETVFLTYSVPQIIICDNGVQMKSREFQKLVNKYNTKIQYTSLYNPRADPAERTNRTLKTMIKCYLRDNHREWDINIPFLTCALRSAKNESIGYSPNFVNFGREIILDGNMYNERIHDSDQQENKIDDRVQGYTKMFQDITKKIKNTQERNRHHYNLRRRPVEYQDGQLVWRKNKVISDATKHFSAKLAPVYIGPFVVKKKIGNCTYELTDESGNPAGRWHVQELKPVNE